MLEELKREVCQANLQLVAEGLVLHTLGNVSGIDRRRGIGGHQAVRRALPQDEAHADGRRFIGDRQSHRRRSQTQLGHGDPPGAVSRLPGQIGGVVHTHSLYATAWAQAGRAIPAHGTTHADYWYGEVPCTRPLTPEGDQGRLRGQHRQRHCGEVPAPGRKRAPGCPGSRPRPVHLGRQPHEAVHNAVVLEFVARLASKPCASTRASRHCRSRCSTSTSCENTAPPRHTARRV